MNMPRTHDANTYECRAVEVLTSPHTGTVFGYCLGGGRPGPKLLVSGFEPQIGELFDKLIDIPTLPWMWGQLYLVNLGALDEENEGNPAEMMADVHFDDIVYLPTIDAASDVAPTAGAALRVVLRACAGMGMIAGRGLPGGA